MRIRLRRVIGIALYASAAPLVGCARPMAPPRDPASREPTLVVVPEQDTVAVYVTTMPFDTLGTGVEVVGREGRDPGDRCRYADSRHHAREG